MNSLNVNDGRESETDDEDMIGRSHDQSQMRPVKQDHLDLFMDNYDIKKGQKDSIEDVTHKSRQDRLRSNKASIDIQKQLTENGQTKLDNPMSGIYNRVDDASPFKDPSEMIQKSNEVYPLRIPEFTDQLMNMQSYMSVAQQSPQEDDFDDQIINPDEDADQDQEEDESQIKGESDHEKNLEKYLETFGTEFDIPGIFVQNMKFYPHDPEYFVQIIKYKIPEDKTHSSKIEIKTVKCDSKTDPVIQPLQEYAKDPKYKHASIRLMKKTKEICGLAIPLAQKYIICFSSDGQYLAVLMRNLQKQYNKGQEAFNNRLDIYKIGNDIEHFFHENLSHGELPFAQFFDTVYESRLKNINYVEFDQENNHFVMMSPLRLNFIRMDADKPIFLEYEFQLNEKYFSRIIEVEMGDIDGIYDRDNLDVLQTSHCEVACISKDQNSVSIFNIGDNQEEVAKNSESQKSQRKINFEARKGEKIRAKISTDFKTVIVSHRFQNYILALSESSEDGVNYNQTQISWMKQKQVKWLLCDGSEDFYMISCKDYDRKLSVISSNQKKQKDLEIAIDRRISPDSVKIFDVVHTDDEINVISMRDQDIFIDKIEHEKAKCDEQKDFKRHLSQYNIQMMEGFGFHWPYITLKVFDDHQMILNANDPNLIINIELNREITRVVKSFFTETYDLFLLVEKEDSYQILQIDLDRYEKQLEKQDQIFKVKTKLDFDKRIVKNQDLKDFHVRASSAKAKINFNKKLQAFFIFGSEIYTWCNGQKEPKFFRETISVNFERLNDDLFSIATLKQSKNHDDGVLEYLQIRVEFSGFDEEILYRDKQETYIIDSFGYDQTQKIMVLYQHGRFNRYTQLSVIETDGYDSTILFNAPVKDEVLIGRLKNMRFLFNDGHIYFNDNVIKLRYDLLKNKSNTHRALNEYELFDYYFKILNYKQNDWRCDDSMPLADVYNHRLAYVKYNKKSFDSIKVLIVPYLHERKVYLNQPKKDCEYFHTTLRRLAPPEDLNQSALQLQKSSNSKSGKKFAQKEAEEKTIVQFISINLTEHKCHYYNLKGILQKRIDFGEKERLFGHAKAVSNNGKVFIFKKEQSLILNVLVLTGEEFIFAKKINLKSAIDEIIRDKGKEPQDFELQDDFSQYQDRKNCDFVFQINDKMDVCVVIRPNQYSIKQDLQRLMKQKTHDQINKFGNDHLKRMATKIKDDSHEKYKRGLVYIELGHLNKNVNFEEKINGSNISDEIKQSLKLSQRQHEGQIAAKCARQLFLTMPRDEKQIDKQLHDYFEQGFDDFSINECNIFFWNEHKIWYIDMCDLERLQIKKLDLYVSESNKQTKVLSVKTTGVTTEKVGIFVRQTPSSVSYILWNIPLNCEVESFDHGNNPKAFWDQQGNAYITEEDKVYIVDQGVCLKCFEVQEVNYHPEEDHLQCNFDTHQGFRFDSDQHSWLFLQQYVNLSYSYMTSFKNLEVVDTYLNDDFLFDQEQYNYVMNKKSGLLILAETGQLLTNPLKLEYILSNFNKSDPILLDILQYHYKDKNGQIVTPLHIAFQRQNVKSINIILKYLAMLDYSQFKTFRDIFPELVDYQKFSDFLYEQTFISVQTQNKQSLRVAAPFSDNIISIASASSSFIDEDFYTDRMHQQGNESGYNSYPVKVEMLEVGWILNQKRRKSTFEMVKTLFQGDQMKQENDDFGYQFLKKIWDSQNIHLFEIPAIMILTEFLFDKYKTRVLSIRLPFYGLALLIFFGTVYFHEAKHSTKEDKEKLALEATLDAIALENAETIELVLGISNVVCTLYEMMKILFQTLAIGRTYWKTKWAAIDTVYSLLNLTVSFMIIYPIYYEVGWIKIELLRRLEAVTAIVIWVKSLYFMELFDVVSPLIKSIFKMFEDVQFFTIILVLALISFAFSYFLLGRNQLQYDDFKSGGSKPLYATAMGSFQFIYYIALGEVGFIEGFEFGEKATHENYLWALFVLSSFIIIIHMMNMLVAIMTETFEKNEEMQKLVILKTKLRFVIDNFVMFDPFTKEDQSSYIVTAFLNEEEEEEIELLNEYEESFLTFRDDTAKQTTKVLNNLNRLRNRVNKLTKQ